MFFSFFECLGILVLGRERSIGRSDGSTSLNMDIVLILFSEVSICICLSHIFIQFVKISLFKVVWSTLCGRLRQRGRERIFPV